MTVILQGSLRRFPLRQLLPLFGEHKHSGRLDIEARGQRVSLYFRDGLVIPGREDLPSMIAAVMTEDEASFSFADDRDLPAGAREEGIAVQSLLEEAEKRSKALRAFPEDTRFHVVETQAAKQEISLRPEQFKLLFRIGAGRSFGELMAAGDLPPEILADLLRDLEKNGLIEREGAPRKEGNEPARAKKPAAALTSNTPHLDAVHPLVADAYTIGRDPANSIVISDASVSSRHARITRDEDGFVVEDLGSRNGTFVNGEQVSQPVSLADNDTIRFGKIVFTFNVASELKRGAATRSGSALP